MPRKSALIILLLAAFVSGCALVAKKEAPPPLAGKRIDITLRPDQLHPTPGANAEEFLIAPEMNTPLWNQAGGNSAHYLQHVALPGKVVRAWSRSIGRGASRTSRFTNAPVVHSGRVFAMDTAGEVTALETRTGKHLWSVELPFEEADMAARGGGLAVQGDILFITTAGGQVFALTASTGKKVWDIDLSVPLRAAPTVEGETLYIISHDNRMFALSALDGSLQWTHTGMENTLGLMNSAAPAADNGIVMVPYTSGEMFALRSTDGRFIWQDTLATPYTGQDPHSTITSIAAPPVVADGLVYAVGLNGGLSAYGLSNGQRFWKADIITSQQPWVSGMQIFALTDNGELVGLNRKDGGIRWVTDLNRGLEDKGVGSAKRLWTGPVLAGNRLMVASSDGFALSIRPETGERLAATEIGEGISVSPIAADGGLYFLTDKGNIICFRDPSRASAGRSTSGSLMQNMSNFLSSTKSALSLGAE